MFWINEQKNYIFLFVSLVTCDINVNITNSRALFVKNEPLIFISPFILSTCVIWGKEEARSQNEKL